MNEVGNEVNVEVEEKKFYIRLILLFLFAFFFSELYSLGNDLVITTSYFSCKYCKNSSLIRLIILFCLLFVK